MADKIARCPASANTTVRRSRASSRPVNSGRCEHHQRAAGTFNGFARFLSCSIAPVFHPILFPCVLQSITDCSPLFPSFFLPIPNSTFLYLYSSFDPSASLSRLLFCPYLFWFFPTLLRPGSLERACLTVICPWQKKDSRSQGYVARVAYFSVCECRRSNGRSERADCMWHEKNRLRKIGM